MDNQRAPPSKDNSVENVSEETPLSTATFQSSQEFDYPMTGEQINTCKQQRPIVYLINCLAKLLALHANVFTVSFSIEWCKVIAFDVCKCFAYSSVVRFNITLLETTFVGTQVLLKRYNTRTKPHNEKSFGMPYLRQKFQSYLHYTHALTLTMQNTKN